MADSVSELISTPLVELPDSRRVPRHVEDAEMARQLHETDPDSYWEWVATQHRWIKQWDTVRTGGLGEDFRYFEGGQINVADNCVSRWAEDPVTAHRSAVIWEGEPGDVRTLSYEQLADEVTSLAAGLRSLGVKKGDVVAIYLPNMIEAFTAIHACNHIGAIYTVLFAGFGSDAVTSRLQISQAKVVITADASFRRGKRVPLLENLRKAVTDAPSVETIVVVNRTGDEPTLTRRELDYRNLVGRYPDGTDAVAMEPNEPAFLIFTSGTESRPKGLVHSVGGFLLGTWANVRWQVGPEDDDVYWVAADVGWLTFPIQAVIGGLAHGATIVCFEGALDTPTTARFYEICEQHAVTKVLAAPTLLRMLRKFGDELVRTHPLPHLRLITTQGEPLDADTFTWGSDNIAAGVPIINAYGQTETGSTWTYPIYGVDALKAGSAGRAVPGHSFDVLDDAGTPVPPGTKGNLVMTRPFPTLARTVWGDHDRYLNTYFERFSGCYATNDEAVVDRDGHIWVLGRSDDVINVAAHRISTMEIEAVVGSHPEVLEAAVVGVPHETKGTVPVAFVTVREGNKQDEVAVQIKQHVIEQLGGYAQLERAYLTAAMPKTRTGKTMRRVLRDVVVQGAPQGDTSVMEDADALDVVISAVRDGGE